MATLVTLPAMAAKPAVVELQPGASLPQPTKSKAVVIDFNAAWCGPCRQFKPVFDKVAKDMSKKAVFVSVDVDNNPDLAMKFGVRSIPYMVVLREGADPVKRLGFMTYEEFKTFLEDALN